MVVKANQPALLQQIQALFRRADAVAHHQNTTHKPTQNPFRPVAVRAIGEEVDWQREVTTSLSLGHGRLEKRTLCALVLPASQRGIWPSAQQIRRVTRSIGHQKSGKTSHQVVYGITSLSREQAGAEALLEINRAHWGIENRSHWIRDVLWDEDQCRVRTGNTAQALATFRNLALALLRRIEPHNIARASRKCAAKPMRAFIAVLRSSASYCSR